MSFSISLAAILALSATAQGPEAARKAASVAPLVGEEVAAVVHFDLSKLDVPDASRRIFGNLADEADLAAMSKLAGGWIDGLKKAGATDLYVLVDLADMPGLPVLVIPIEAGGDAQAIAGRLTGEGPALTIRWPAAETIRGAVVAGSTLALKRIREAQPIARPELAQALASGDASPILVAILPSLAQRRAIEEALSSLPPEMGNAPIGLVTRGMSWASMAISTAPRPSARLVVQASDPATAEALRKVAELGLGSLARVSRSDPSMAGLAEAIDGMKPTTTGDRVILEADLEKVTALVSFPVREVRESSRRSQCVNNLKSIGLAMHNYHAANNTFPPAYSSDKDGKPLLSWRVLILPYLGEKSLYDQFHLEEPWDSPHNKTLIPRLPKVFQCPSGSKALAAEGKTTYLIPRGPSSMFPGAQGVKIQEITDGTSNTLMTIDASDSAAVIWTRADDVEPTHDFWIKTLFGHHLKGTPVQFADGSVRTLKETISSKLLQAFISRNGGEVLDADDF